MAGEGREEAKGDEKGIKMYYVHIPVPHKEYTRRVWQHGRMK